MTNKEVMQMALNALEVSTEWTVHATGKQAQSIQAIRVLRTALALAQPEKEWVGLTDEEMTNTKGEQA